MVEHHIKPWLYLFAKPGFVEDKDGFELSKKLLFSYLKSPIVAKAFGNNEHIISTVSGFVTNYVLIYAESIVFFKRKTKWNFDVSSNNAHKGTNYGMKSHAAAVRPCHTLNNAGKALTLQGVLRINDIENAVTQNLTKKSFWSNLSTANYVTDYADGILHAVMDRMHKYQCIPISASKWQVFYTDHYAGQWEQLDSNSPIPKFRRI
jgi:hypothetical protein